MEIVRLLDSRLSVRIRVAPPYFVSELEGAADDSGHATLAEWTERMVEEDAPVVVLDMGLLDELSGTAAATLSRGLREAQRLDRGVRLVRCRRSDFDRLTESGLRGDVWHCGSLAQATEGALGGRGDATRLHCRSSLSSLRRLELVLSTLARQLHLVPERTEALRGAVLEAAANAVRHGSPRGVEDTVTVIFHRHPGQLVVEVQDGGRGFPLAQESNGVRLMRRLADELEFLPNPEGFLTRLTLRVPVLGAAT
jgi:anti-sigma regulatory factor (Ser/Thr protein kinase)/anti-anti-sigma regulatory factor